jgi:hypothetical protein
MRMHFKLPSASPAARANAAAAAAAAADLQRTAPSSRSKSSGSGRQRQQQPGDKVYKQLLRESIEQPLMAGGGRPSSARPGSARQALPSSSSSSDGEHGHGSVSSGHDQAYAGNAAADDQHSDSEPSLRTLRSSNKQQQCSRQQLLVQQQREGQARRERRQHRRAAKAAALQAAYRAASPERRQGVASGRASPDVAGTVIEAATASAAAAEVAWHVQQQHDGQLQQEPTLGLPNTASR